MANQNPILVLGAKVHRAAEAVLKHLAICTLARLHPFTVAEGLETVFPNVEEVVLVNVALHETTVDVGTGGDGTVNEDGANGDAGAAKIEPVANLTLIRADVCLATEHRVNLPFFAAGHDEIHQLAELFVAKLQSVVGCGTTNRRNGKETPRFHLVLDEQLFHGLQLAEIHRVDASHDVVSWQTFLIGNQIDGLKSVVETALPFAEGIVRIVQAIKTDSDAAHASVHQFLVHGLVIGIAIADDAPRKTVPTQLPPAIGQIGAHQRLTTRDDNQHRITLELGLQRLDGVQEILERHILVAR